MKKLLILFIFSLSMNMGLAEEIAPVEVTDQTLKIPPTKTEDLYFGFNEGDVIVFSFQEIKGKLLKEIEVIELPTNSKFSDFKASSVESKRIKVHKTGVYKFSFKNGAMTGRICKIHIQRIPANPESVNFNTDWKWQTVYDTTYIPYTEDSIVGYDSTYTTYLQKELIKIDTSYWDEDKNERVHTRLNPNGDKTVIWFDFPKEVKTTYLTKENISWAWWFSTEDAPDISAIASGASELVAGISPVAGLALGVLSLTQKTAGKNIKYYEIKDYANSQLFLNESQFSAYDQGDGSTMSSRSEQRAKGRLFIGFDNDHTYPVDVNIKFSVVVLTKTYEDKEYQKVEATPKIVELNKVKMEINTTEIRVNAD